MDDKAKINYVSSWLGAGSINIFGLPFAGKDTQSKLLADKLGAEIVAGGDILRDHADQARIKEIMSTGELFPTDFYLSIILPFLSKPELEGKGLILSSIGRWHGEEQVILEATEKAGHPLKAVVFIELDSDQVHKRFEISQSKNDRGQRHDDALHVIDVRLQEFKDKTIPVIDTYEQAGLLIRVNGNQSPENVCNEIVNSLFNKATGKK